MRINKRVVIDIASNEVVERESYEHEGAVAECAVYQKFQGFVGYLGLAAVNLNTDVLEVYLSNAAPSASADDVKADLAEITEENGYTGGIDIENAYSEATGTGTLTAVDKTVTASGGTVGPFQYAVIFDETVASPVVDPLMCWFDYASPLTLQNGESFTVNFGASLFTLA
jgi:hypothetical protein